MTDREVRYCTTEDGVRIAFSVSGRGDVWLLHTPNYVSAALQYDVIPGRRAWIEALGEVFTVVQFDQRGTGLSQRECDDLSREAFVLDIAAVAREIPAPQFVMFGFLGGIQTGTMYAREHGGRVSHLILWPPPYTDMPETSRSPLGQLALTDWETFTEMWAHTALGWDRGEESHTYAVVMRQTVTRDTWLRAMGEFIREHGDGLAAFEQVARDIEVPTLVIQRPGYDRFSDIAGAIAGARTRRPDGEGQAPYIGDPRPVVDAMAEFVGVAPVLETTPVANTSDDGRHGDSSSAAVILFTDIVDSTALTERLGDARFRELSRALDAGLRAAIREAGGVAVEGKLLGDGVLATFGSAAQAIDGARRCLALSAASELGLHIGLHAGDVIREEVDGRRDVFGGAVNIAARICGLSAPGEILVSDVVRGMARSSAGVVFEDRGEQEMKGVGDAVRVYRVGDRD